MQFRSTRSAIKAISLGWLFALVLVSGVEGQTKKPTPKPPAGPLPKVTKIDQARYAELIKPQTKPLLINFWATWCGPCLREIPMLKELQASRADLQVVGIAIDKPELVAKFAGEQQFNYAILIGQNEAWTAASALGVNIFALPFTVFTAGDGSILGVHTGELHAEHLAAFQGVTDELEAGRIDVSEARRRIADAI